MSSRIICSAPRIAGRRYAVQASRRYASTTSAPNLNASAHQSHVIAGLAGGGITLLGIYGYYHFSGAKTAVNTVKGFSQQAKAAKDKVVDATPDPKVILGFVRHAAKSYASAIPGAGQYIDQAFDRLDEVAKDHGPEVADYIKQTYEEISTALSKGGDDLSDQILTAVQTLYDRVEKLSSKFSTSAIAPLLAANPKIREALGENFENFRDIAQKHGPEAKKIWDKTVSDLQGLIPKAKNLDASAMTQISDLITKRAKEVKSLAEKAGSDAWDEASKKAGNVFESMPDLKKLVNEKINKYKGSLGKDGQKIVEETYDQLEEIAKKGSAKDKLAKAKELLEEKSKQLAELASKKKDEVGGKAAKAVAGSGGLESLVSKLPGGEKMLEKVPELKQLSELAQQKGEKFEDLFNRAYEDVSKVLKKHVEEGKKLAEESKEDIKKKSK